MIRTDEADESYFIIIRGHKELKGEWPLYVTAGVTSVTSFY